MPARYTYLPPTASGPSSPLLGPTRRGSKKRYNISLYPAFTFRALASIFILTSLIVLATRGHHHYMVSCVFLGLALGHNSVQMVRFFLAPLFSLRLLFTFRGRERELSRTVPYLVWLVDALLTVAMVIAVPVENHSDWQRYYRSGPTDGAIVAYVGIAFQTLLLIPRMDLHYSFKLVAVDEDEQVLVDEDERLPELVQQPYRDVKDEEQRHLADAEATASSSAEVL